MYNCTIIMNKANLLGSEDIDSSRITKTLRKIKGFQGLTLAPKLMNSFTGT